MKTVVQEFVAGHKTPVMTNLYLKSRHEGAREQLQSSQSEGERNGTSEKD